ncbi:hypothetical protein [Vallitalea maricola]|uniref:Uncharacterized protein n=1 Tax=Vallitalea maricola TaxID=3074433 RepID=A0ACB5UP65_9FIRM|nr:hypothetical protein AN2V17_35650 [Vallitalea sp. AN17-2]
MKTVKSIEIKENQSIYIQKLYYEMTGLQSLIKTIVSDLDDKFDAKMFQSIKNQYIKASNIFNLALNELCLQYAPEFTSNKYQAQVEFNCNTLYIKEACK